MAQFDVHRNLGRTRAAVPYVVIVQSSRFAQRSTRLVVPLLLASNVESHDSQLTPLFEIEDQKVVLHPLQLVPVDVERLGACVGSLKSEGNRVIAAIDLVISRAWD